MCKDDPLCSNLHRRAIRPVQLTRDAGFELLRKTTQIAARVIKSLHFQFPSP